MIRKAIIVMLARQRPRVGRRRGSNGVCAQVANPWHTFPGKHLTELRSSFDVKRPLVVLLPFRIKRIDYPPYCMPKVD